MSSLQIGKWTLIVAWIVAGCGKAPLSDTGITPEPAGDGGTPELSGPGTFAALPLTLDRIKILYPLGHLSPSGHTVPTDHIYFYYLDYNNMGGESPSTSYVVYAPGSGQITGLMKPVPGQDDKITVKMSSTFSYYLDHVMLDGGFAVGQTITAGQRLGTTSPYSLAVDMGVINLQNALPGFVNPSRYHDQTRYADAPLKYYEASLQSALYAKVRRSGGDKDGKIDFDQPGKLVGNWYHESVAANPDASNGSQDGWSKSLAFVFDPESPSYVRISMGGHLGLTGVYAIPDGALSPNQVTTASGKVSYPLKGFDYSTRAVNPYAGSGLLIVEMLTDQSLRVEVFPGSQADTADFTANARIYVR